MHDDGISYICMATLYYKKNIKEIKKQILHIEPKTTTRKTKKDENSKNSPTAKELPTKC